jgi:hypothetical protein
VSPRRDLLLEILALRHPLGVLARSNRRFRLSDRLLWLCLRALRPQWREALVEIFVTDPDRSIQVHDINCCPASWGWLGDGAIVATR